MKYKQPFKFIPSNEGIVDLLLNTSYITLLSALILDWPKVDALLTPFLHPSYTLTMMGQSGATLYIMSHMISSFFKKNLQLLTLCIDTLTC